MAQKISESLGLKPAVFRKFGIFDGFIDIDAQYYIDPRLLSICKTPELKNSHKKFEKYFEDVIRLLEASQSTGDRLYREVHKKLQFKENASIGLGYCTSHKGGTAIGSGIAEKLATTVTTIIKAGIKDPTIFELVGLFEEGVGADRISDMTGRIILPELLAFTDRVSNQLGISNLKKYSFRYNSFSVPFCKKHLILVPSEILSPLPVAYDWSDIDYVCSHNVELRYRVNQIIGDTWKQATNKNRVSKKDLKAVILENPEILRDLISQYGSKKPKYYDFDKDPFGELIWYDISKQFTSRYGLDLTRFKDLTETNVYNTIIALVEKFKDLVENNGLCQLFYDDRNKLRHERFPQLLFYGIADSYCQSNNLDINREPNAGRGSVDFKFSRGYNIRVNVEIKYSSNSNIINGYQKQLDAYDKAEKTFHSIYMVIQTTRSSTGIDNISKMRHTRLGKNLRTPDVIVVDGRLQKSASKLRK